MHFITNYVTVNDCANMTLALGGSPIMADDLREVEQIVGHCSALVLNIGTLSERTVQSMLAAGKEANRLGRPVVFDPVGVGASRFRNETVAMLLREVRFDVIKGNISEIAYLAEGIGTTKGVDANLDALSTEGNLRWHTDLARKVSTQTGAAIVISGPIDIVADSHEAWAIRNGHPMMANITGTGCMSAGSSAAAWEPTRRRFCRPASAPCRPWGFAGSWRMRNCCPWTEVRGRTVSF